MPAGFRRSPPSRRARGCPFGPGLSRRRRGPDQDQVDSAAHLLRNPPGHEIQRLLVGGWRLGLVVFVLEVVLEVVALGVVRLVVDFFLVFEVLVPF